MNNHRDVTRDTNVTYTVTYGVSHGAHTTPHHTTSSSSRFYPRALSSAVYRPPREKVLVRNTK